MIIGRFRPANIAPAVRLPQSKAGSREDHVRSPAIIVDIALVVAPHIMKLFVSFASVVIASFAAGCGSTEVRTADHYDRGQTPAAQFQREAANCDKQAEADQKLLGNGPYDPTQSTYNRMFDACMRASGYAPKAK